MDVIPPGNSSNSANGPQPVSPTPAATSSPSVNPTPTVVSEETSKPVNYFIPGILIAMIFLGLAGVIAVRVYKPDITNLMAFFANMTQPSSEPLQQVSTDSTEQKLDLIDIAYANAQKIINKIPLDAPDIVSAGIFYSYRGTVVNIEKNPDGSLKVITDNAVTGISNTWDYTQNTNTFILPSFESTASSNLKLNDKVLMGAFFAIKSNQSSFLVNNSNLISVGLYPSNTNLTNSAGLNIPAEDNTSNQSISTLPDIVIKDSSTKKAFENSISFLKQIDYRDPNIDSLGIQYTYKGKLIDVAPTPNGQTKITTDTQIAGLPDTWDVDKNTVIFQQKTKQKISPSDLKKDMNVLITAIFNIKGTVLQANQLGINAIIVTP